ncbi:MAG: di-heme-cytochrome C peroxidase [Pseudomonadota bacterium]
MTTLQQARWNSRWVFFRNALILLVLLWLVGKLLSDSTHAFLDAIRSPQLPSAPKVEDQRYLDQGWSEAIREEFHHVEQGSRTLPIPYRWFAALERPSEWALGSLTSSDNLFADPDYLRRFGFLVDQIDCGEGSYASWRKHTGRSVPDSADCGSGRPPDYRAADVDGTPRRAYDPPVPIGFTLSKEQPLDGLRGRRTAIGLTCAACHTGSLMHDNTQFIVDGGPGNADFGVFSKTLAAAIGQTLLSSRLPVLNGRFEEFASRVLGEQNSPGAREVLRADMVSAVKVLKQFQHRFDVVEGAGRLDALSRIGNRVFSRNMQRPENYAPINAPVSYPHIWTASWFDWVQYDGSIMNPLVRNAGEALGVGAAMDVTSPNAHSPNEEAPDQDHARLATGIPLDKLAWIEDALKGTEFTQDKPGGLWAPKWDEAAFGPVDAAEVEYGRELYEAHCQSCHMPAMASDAFWQTKNDKGKLNYRWRPFKWKDADGKEHSYEKPLLRLKMISLAQIGTDPMQSSLLEQRMLNTAAILERGERPHDPALGLSESLCIPVKRARNSDGSYDVESGKSRYKTSFEFVTVKDTPSTAFGVALGAATTAAIEATFDATGASQAQRDAAWTDRPNCYQVGAGYKARPLNGVWATGPFLHNGSVPTIDDLLGPVEDRPELVLLGSPVFDTKKLGIKQPDRVRGTENHYDSRGRFVLDTSLPGNSNRGHEFSDKFDKTRAKKPQGGVIGPALDENKRRALIAFIKTL